MKFVTFQRRSRSMRAGILLNNNRVLDLGRAYTRLHEVKSSGNDTLGLIDSLRGLGSSLQDILDGGDDALTNCFEVERAAEAGQFEELTFSIDEAPLVSPIPAPPLMLHFNAYEESARAEAIALGAKGADPLPRSWYDYPLFYIGNSHNLLGVNSPVTFPEAEDQMDFEAELAVVLGEDVRDASLEDAEDAILGYTMVLDWTARRLEAQLASNLIGPCKAKMFCTSVGPFIATKDEIPDPSKLVFTIRIDGQAVAQATAESQRYTFAEMISYASEGTVLPAGTILSAGALPGGTCLGSGHFLKGGSTVELECEELGVLRSRVWERQQARMYQPKGE